MDTFEVLLKGIFDVSKIGRRNLELMGCSIQQDNDCGITLSQNQMLSDLSAADMLDSIDGINDTPSNEMNATEYRRLIGKMLFIGRISMPVMQLHASIAASKMSDLMMHHL